MSDALNLEDHIRNIPDFPIPGIQFKDITPLLAHGPAFQQVIQRFTERYAGSGIDAVVGIESRGFIFSAPVAFNLGVGLIPYGIGLLVLARRRATRGTLLTIAALNFAWIVASALLLLSGLAALTTGGNWTVGIIALLVADLAALQLYAARKA